eukprot:CAMPEP_0204575178 /NCGR_PEP_ID=MMETSP0661-20131031/41035_1 /ASSEMBLY_ACC=CAM_ASM_000606 /TAXON_ID=109239 /ORGANISM="Alexandrium margalefi, Strain AMGDE01CS-322" /LENGTH=196 /DNA_ID=CAMNT_0051583771 /DNA_START=360 /DNA_END=950 /DNA_ORIENTATION=-
MTRNLTSWACETEAVCEAFNPATPHACDEVHSVPILDPAIAKHLVVLQHFAGGDQALLLDAHAGAVFHPLLQAEDAVLRAHVDSGGLAQNVPDEDLHLRRRLALTKGPEHAQDALLRRPRLAHGVPAEWTRRELGEVAAADHVLAPAIQDNRVRQQLPADATRGVPKCRGRGARVEWLDGLLQDDHGGAVAMQARR